MRKGIIGAIIISLGMLFSQVAVSAEMIRYEHQMYQSKKTQKHTATDKWRNKSQQVSYSNRYQKEKETFNKVGHPVFIAFPDRK